MLNISRIKGHQTIKFGQLIEYPRRNNFSLKIMQKMSRNTRFKLLFVSLKNFILGKSKWSAAWFYYISIALKLAYNRNKLFNTLHYWSRDMLNFEFLYEGLGRVSPAHFVHGFATKMLLILYSIYWPNFIVSLPLRLEILSNMCVTIVC